MSLDKKKSELNNEQLEKEYKKNEPSHHSNKNIEEDLFYSNYQIAMESILRENEFFYYFEQAIGKAMFLYDKQKISFFDSYQGKFAKEILARMLEECSGYIGCLKQGSFSSSVHHTRALIELFATTTLIVSDKGKKKRFLERYFRYPEIEFHKIYIKHNESILDFSKDILEQFFYPYAELKDDLLKIFDKDNHEQLLEMKHWRGNLTIENLLDMVSDSTVHKKNYDKLCLYTHFSSIIRRSESKFFPTFTSKDEEMLAITIKYAFDSIFTICNERYLDNATINIFKEIFLPISTSLLPIIQRLSSPNKKV